MWIFAEWKDPSTKADPEIFLVDLPASAHDDAVNSLAAKLCPSDYHIEEIVESLMVVVMTFRKTGSSFRYTRIFYENYRKFDDGILELP